MARMTHQPRHSTGRPAGGRYADVDLRVLAEACEAFLTVWRDDHAYGSVFGAYLGGIERALLGEELPRAHAATNPAPVLPGDGDEATNVAPVVVGGRYVVGDQPTYHGYEHGISIDSTVGMTVIVIEPADLEGDAKVQDADDEESTFWIHPRHLTPAPVSALTPDEAADELTREGQEMEGPAIDKDVLAIARAVLASGLVVPAADAAGARSDHWFTWGLLNEQTAKLDALRAAVFAKAQHLDSVGGEDLVTAAELRDLVGEENQ